MDFNYRPLIVIYYIDQKSKLADIKFEPEKTASHYIFLTSSSRHKNDFSTSS